MKLAYRIAVRLAVLAWIILSAIEGEWSKAAFWTVMAAALIIDLSLEERKR